jgi:hypothetical protein
MFGVFAEFETKPRRERQLEGIASLDEPGAGRSGCEQSAIFCR